MTKADRTKQFIIEKSAPIFNTKGIAATAISDIVAATKMAKGSLYVHFEHKEDLSFAAVDYVLDRLVQRVLIAVNHQKTAKAKLFAYLDTVSDTINSPVLGGCPILNFGMEADDTSPVIKQKVNKVIQASQQVIAEIIEQGINDQEFISTWNAREFAIKMFAMTEGGILISRVAGNNEAMKVIVKIIKKEIEEQAV